MDGLVFGCGCEIVGGCSQKQRMRGAKVASLGENCLPMTSDWKLTTDNNA